MCEEEEEETASKQEEIVGNSSGRDAAECMKERERVETPVYGRRSKLYFGIFVVHLYCRVLYSNSTVYNRLIS